MKNPVSMLVHIPGFGRYYWRPILQILQFKPESGPGEEFPLTVKTNTADGALRRAARHATESAKAASS